MDPDSGVLKKIENVKSPENDFIFQNIEIKWYKKRISQLKRCVFLFTSFDGFVVFNIYRKK